MKIAFYETEKLFKGSYRIHIFDLCKYFNKLGHKSKVNPNNVDEFDVIIYGKNLEPVGASNFSVKEILLDNRNYKIFEIENCRIYTNTNDVAYIKDKKVITFLKQNKSPFYSVKTGNVSGYNDGGQVKFTILTTTKNKSEILKNFKKNLRIVISRWLVA